MLEHELNDRAADWQDAGPMGEAEVRFLTAEGNTVSTRPLAPAAGQQLKAWSIEQVWQAVLGEPLEPRPSRSVSETVETGAGDGIWAQAIAEVWEDLGRQPGCGYMQDMCISAEAVDVLGAWMRNWLESVLGEATRLARYRLSTARASKAGIVQDHSCRHPVGSQDTASTRSGWRALR
ncbi:unnamed protein product [Symbiodinium sp. CCMP2592]|nr:unnamed protein product [Symbiodinium sp. CCMP2592]